ncbi:helix-turn-helix transcriptional regulator [Streptomonospora nanhaiensis]|uniref:Helix-turn-helix transcriptional regulator n=1 Tax=Streptomonospora nanhaiensis TaxID=1323731 RepID=A0ABY6YUA6_9ACTN|nr:helix-turn-helix transcriptional regulator [Streptomonospora nanhaiensis]WAE75975.1 helix-turn-helix transcriptional regulator [Streptomonospora nanhaiensis]
MNLPQSRAVGVSNVHEARTALGNRLRGLRKQAGLSGRELAESLSWQASKISKIENGKQTPSDQDVLDWTRATNSESEAEDLLASLHTLEIQHAEWQRQLRAGLKLHQNEIAELNARTRLFRVFESTYIPGLLQTAGYARFRFAQSITVFKIRNDINEAVQARIQRQDILYRPDKRFHFVITEAALRYRLCPPEAMLAQLDRLVSMSALPNVRLGIIGFETAYVVAPAHGFWLLDDERVMVETFSAELNLAQPQETGLYGRVFESLAGVASYGRSARAIITRVIDDLSSELPENG